MIISSNLGLEQYLIMHKPWFILKKTVFRHLKYMNLRDKWCVCNWSPGYVILPNYEVMGFQPWSGITTPLVYVACCCVPFTCLLFFYICLPIPSIFSCPPPSRLMCLTYLQLCHRTGSSDHLGVDRICIIIDGQDNMYSGVYRDGIANFWES